MIEVNVAYIVPGKVFLESVMLPEHSTIQDAIVASGVLDEFTELDMDTLDVGIFNEKAVLSDIVSNGDRIEIYRPLLIDPMEARRRRAGDKSKQNK